jgi:hypothetical protein
MRQFRLKTSSTPVAKVVAKRWDPYEPEEVENLRRNTGDGPGLPWEGGLTNNNL